MDYNNEIKNDNVDVSQEKIPSRQERLNNKNREQEKNDEEVKVTSSNNSSVDVRTIYANQLKNDGLEFSELKNSKVGVFLLVGLLLLIILLGGGYYFILDNPKTIFKKSLDSLFTSYSDNYILDVAKKASMNTELKLNIQAGNGEYKDYQELFDVINEFNLNINLGIDLDKEIVNLLLGVNYKEDNLLNIDTMLETNKEGNLYIDLGSLYDKKIKVNLDSSSVDEFDNNEEELDYVVIVNSFERILKETLDSAKYSKEYVKLDGEYVKKVSIYIDKEFLSAFGTKILNDGDLMTSLINVSGSSEDEIREDINYLMEEDYNDEVNLYLSIFGNDFIKLVIGNDYTNVAIFMEDDNKYMFEAMSEYTLMYKGYVMIDREDENYIFGLNLEIVPSDFTIGITEKMVIDMDADISLMDTSDSVLYTELTDNDMEEIINNYMDLDAVRRLVEDLGLDQILNDNVQYRYIV